MLLVETQNHVKDYKEAILITCDRMRRSGLIRNDYYHAILEQIEEYGAYFYLGNGICMPHARSKDGVIRSGICVLKLKTPVDFLGHPVQLFFTLAGQDEEAHYEQMRRIGQVCLEKQGVEKLLHTDDRQELCRILGEEAWEDES